MFRKDSRDGKTTGYAVLTPPKEQNMGLLIPPASIYSNSMHVHDRSDLHAVMQLSNPQVGAIMQQIREKESQLETLSAELAAAEQSLRTWQQHQANRRSKESFPEPAGPLALEDLQQSIKAEYTASSASMLHPIAASTMIELQGSTLAAQRSEVLLRWQCLLEDKKQLRLMMAAAKGAVDAIKPGRLHDFEPGTSPLRDVTCSVITHQMDVPCFSCCFQR